MPPFYPILPSQAPTSHPQSFPPLALCMGPLYMVLDRYLIIETGRGRFGPETHRGRRPCEPKTDCCCHKLRNTGRSQQKLAEVRDVFPQSLQRQCGPDSTLVSDFGVQSCERTNFYCFKLPSLWYFVMAAQEN